MGTTWKIDAIVYPKEGKINEVADILNEERFDIEEITQESILAQYRGKGSYNWRKLDFDILADKLEDMITQGKVFAKDIEPASRPHPADVEVDLLSKDVKVRSKELIEEVL